jgi:hypothetical protein
MSNARNVQGSTYAAVAKPQRKSAGRPGCFEGSRTMARMSEVAIDWQNGPTGSHGLFISQLIDSTRNEPEKWYLKGGPAFPMVRNNDGKSDARW